MITRYLHYLWFSKGFRWDAVEQIDLINCLHVNGARVAHQVLERIAMR